MKNVTLISKTHGLEQKCNRIINFAIAFLILLFIWAGKSFGQSASWNYCTQNGNIGTSYNWISASGGTGIVNGDDAAGSFYWPFTFKFYDNTYTTSNQLSVCTNGFIRLNGIATTDANTANIYNLTSSATNLGQIIALAVWDNEVVNRSWNDNYCRYIVSGSSPNRILIIEFNDLRIDYNDNNSTDVEVRFYETSNKIVILLGTKNSINHDGVDIGIHSGVVNYYHKWGEVEDMTADTWIEYSPPPAAPTGISASPSTICSGAYSTISVTAPGAGLTTDWYTVSCGGTEVPGGMGVNSLSVSPMTTTTYYARTRNTSTGCLSTACANVTVTVNNPSVEPINISGTGTVCSGNSTALTSSGGTLGTDAKDVWYKGSCAAEAFTQEWTTQPYTVSNTTVNSVSGGILNVTSLSGDPMIWMTNVGPFDAASYKYIQVRYRVTSGTAGMVEIYYSKTDEPGLDESKVVRVALTSDDSWHIVNLDMSTSAKWTGTILGWRYDWCTQPGVTTNLDFITLANQPLIDVGTSITVSPTTSTTYYTRKKGACNSTGCVSKLVTVFSDCNALHYHTTGSGSWTSLGTWKVSESESGPTWIDAPVYPTSSVMTIKVLDGNTVTVNANIAVDQFTIEAGGKVTVSNGFTLANSGNANQFVINSLYDDDNDVWSSGSLMLEGTGSVSGNITYNRQMRQDDYHYFSSPVNGQNKISFKSNNSDVSQIWTWIENQWFGTNQCWYNCTDENSNFEMGRGYNLVQNTGTGMDGKFSFTGFFVTSAGPIPVTSIYSDCSTWLGGSSANYDTRPKVPNRPYAGGGWNLLGNPFTCALKVSGTGSFITNNSSQFDPNYMAVYIYDAGPGTGTYGKYWYKGTEIPGYSNVALTGGEEFPYNDIQVGQGFFVLARCNNGSETGYCSFSFDQGMQTHHTDVPFKSSKVEDPWPGLQLKVNYCDQEYSTLIVYNSEMTVDLDPGYDIGLLSAGNEMEIYTRLIMDGGVDYTRQALPFGDYETNIIPVGIDSENGGEVTFSVYIVPIEERKFILEDRLTNIFTDLETDTYTITIPPQTYGTGRFYIHSVSAVGFEELQPEAQDQLNIKAWAYDHQVNVEGDLSDKAMATLYDLMGRAILETRLSGDELNTFTVPAFLKGIYILQVMDGQKVAVRKVVF